LHQVAKVLEFQPLLAAPVPHSPKQNLGPKELKPSRSQHRYLRNSILGIEYYYLFSPKRYLLYFLYPRMGNHKCIFKIFLQYIVYSTNIKFSMRKDGLDSLQHECFKTNKLALWAHTAYFNQH